MASDILQTVDGHVFSAIQVINENGAPQEVCPQCGTEESLVVFCRIGTDIIPECTECSCKFYPKEDSDAYVCDVPPSCL